MLAFLLLGSASGLLSRAQLGALPALWRIETDVSELDDYLKRPDLVSKAASLVQTDKGPDCECINKNAKVGGPDCECINKAPEAVATARKDVADLDALKKKVESADVKDMPTMLALLKSMYARFQTNIADAQKLEANADATFATDEKTLSKTEAAAAEKARAASAQRFSATLAVAERGVKELDDGLSTLSSAKGSFLAVREKLLRYCAGALIELRAAKKGPDCECINKNAKVGGPDCECINKAPVVLAKTEAKKGPDCECINKNAKVGGPDCECINKAPALLAKAKATNCQYHNEKATVSDRVSGSMNLAPGVLATTVAQRAPDCEWLNSNA
jgi:hypothetical protein